jgi:Uma2 family endonuclease
MADTARTLMSPEEFLVWCLTQEQKWEYVDGVPVLKDVLDPATGMTGTTRAHDTVTGNVFAHLYFRLKGSTCRVHTQDLAVRTRKRTRVRRPDIHVDCGGVAGGDLDASRPVLVAEVLSPSNRQADFLRKIDEYKALASLRHILMIEPERPFVLHFHRMDEGEWDDEVFQDRDAQITLHALGVALSLAEVYSNVSLMET